MAEFSDYSWLTGAEAARVLADAVRDDRPLHQRLASLRGVIGPVRAGLVVELVEQRARGAEKFGPLAERLFGTRTQWEQATDAWIARYKAARFATAGSGPVEDFCTGMGGDLVALAERRATTGWDLSEAAVAFAEANLAAVGAERGAVRQGDVEDCTPDVHGAWHVDPDRRVDGRRSTTPELHSPTPATIDRWLAPCPPGALKLAPATRPLVAWIERAEWEWISRGRECRQLVAWFGDLRTSAGGGEGAARRATRVVPRAGVDSALESYDHELASFAASPQSAENVVDAPRQFVFEPDPALIAAELVGAMANERGLATLGPGSVYLTGDKAIASPLLAAFEVEEEVPLRTAAVASRLAERRVGVVEVKVRGVAHSPEQFRRALKLRGENTATVFLTRIGRRETALIARRVPSD